jgi:hypothetical protein
MDLKCEIEMLMVDYIDDQPGFAKCRFKDSNGIEINLIEKIPVLTTEQIDENTILPTTISLPGFVSKKDYETKEIIKFSADYYIEDVDGNSDFMIFRKDLKIKTAHIE